MEIQSNTKPLSCSIILGYTKDLSISVVGKLWTYAHISIQGSKAVCISLIHHPPKVSYATVNILH